MCVAFGLDEPGTKFGKVGSTDWGNKESKTKPGFCEADGKFIEKGKFIVENCEKFSCTDDFAYTRQE